MQRDGKGRPTFFINLTIKPLLVTAGITALLVGGGTYLAQRAVYRHEIAVLNQSSASLEKKMKTLEADIEASGMQKEDLLRQIEKLQSDLKAVTENNKTAVNARISELNAENSSLRQKVSELQNTVAQLKGNTGDKVNAVVAPRATEAVMALKNKDMKKLSSLIHPSKGIRFSPYAFVDMKSNRVLTAAQVQNALTDPNKYTWGSFDGSGDPIHMTYTEYLNRFVYNKDYAGTNRIGYNQTLGKGNTINNASEVYPNAIIVEYHIPGSDPKYGGIDWGSLRLVFEESGSVWYLVGIIHDEWTI